MINENYSRNGSVIVDLGNVYTEPSKAYDAIAATLNGTGIKYAIKQTETGILIITPELPKEKNTLVRALKNEMLKGLNPKNGDEVKIPIRPLLEKPTFYEREDD